VGLFVRDVKRIVSPEDGDTIDDLPIADDSKKVRTGCESMWVLRDHRHQDSHQDQL
jgi:hypothetical protein